MGIIFRRTSAPRLNALRRNTIQGSVFSHTIELSPNLNRSTSQSSVETNNPFFPSHDSGYVDGIQLRDNGSKENVDNVINGNEDEYAKAESSKVSQNGKGQIVSNEYDSHFSSSTIKEKLMAISNEMLPSGCHLQNVTSTKNEACDDGFKESVANDESASHSKYSQKVNGNHRGSPIIRSRHDSMNNGVDDSNENISRKRYINSKQRKCSFSSFNECRYLEDNGKTTTTYFFSSDAETLRPNRKVNRLFDKLASSDQLNIADIKNDERVMNGHSINSFHRNGSPVKRAIKRNSKNIGYSNSFNVSADIRRKLFVNRYKEWSFQTYKKPGSNHDVNSIPPQNRYSDISYETNNIHHSSNTPLIQESKVLNHSLLNGGAPSEGTTRNETQTNDNKEKAVTNGHVLSVESDISTPKHLKPEAVHRPLLRPFSVEENNSKMKPSNSFLSINQAFSSPSLAPNSPPLNQQSGSLLSMTSHVSIKVKCVLIIFHENISHQIQFFNLFLFSNFLMIISGSKTAFI